MAPEKKQPPSVVAKRERTVAKEEPARKSKTYKKTGKGLPRR